MINVYALSYINLILFVILGLGVLFYKFVFPKKEIKLFPLLLLILLLPTWSIFRFGVYESGDLSLHITQSITFFKSLSEGIFVPRWAGELNATYGFPAFIFIYPLPYYIISLFHLIGFSFITATKLLLATCFIGSGLTMYYWIKDEFNQRAGFIAAIFYVFAPYHLVDMHFRADIGEIAAFVILPLILYFIKKYFENKSVYYFAFLAISFAAIILSHPAISLASLPLIFAYILFCFYKLKKNDIKILIQSCLSLFFGILLSAFSWIPTLFLLPFTHQNLLASVTFPKFAEFIFTPWRYGLLFQSSKGELAYILGYMQIVIIFYVFYLLISKKGLIKEKVSLKFYLGLFLGYFLMMQSFSQPLWKIIPFIKNFQFAYRLLFYTSFFTAILAAISLYKFKNKKLLVLIISVTIISTFLNWGNRKVIPEINDNYLIKMLPLSTANGGGLAQATPIWTDPKNTWMSVVPKNHLEPISGSAEIKEIKRSTNLHAYKVNVFKEGVFKENTLYFPGWNLYVNSVKTPISITKNNPKGIIEFKLEKGLQNVVLIFEDKPIVKTANITSLFSFLAILFLLTASFVKHAKFPKRFLRKN